MLLIFPTTRNAKKWQWGRYHIDGGSGPQRHVLNSCDKIDSKKRKRVHKKALLQHSLDMSGILVGRRDRQRKR